MGKINKINKSTLNSFIDGISKLLLKDERIINSESAKVFLGRAKERLVAVNCLAGNDFSADDIDDNLTTCYSSLPGEVNMGDMSGDDKVSACCEAFNIAVVKFTEPFFVAKRKKETYRRNFLAVGIIGEVLELIVSVISTFIDANWFGWAVVGVRTTQIICLVLSLFSVIAFCFDVVPSVDFNGKTTFRKRIAVAKTDHNKLIFGSFMFITLLIGAILTIFILKGLPLFASLILLGFAAIVFISFLVTIYIADDKPNSDKKPDVNNTVNINISSTQQPNPNNEESSHNNPKISDPPADITQQSNHNNEESSDNNIKTNGSPATTINANINQTGNKTTSTPLVIFIILFFAVVILVGVFVANPQFLYGTSTITYKIDDITQTKSVVYNQKYSIEVPQKTGYTFLGLYDKEENGVQYVDAKGDCVKAWDSKIRNENKELFAQWKINTYTFIYNIKGGEGQDLNNFECDYEADLPALASNVSKRGYTFLGWVYSENKGAKLISDCNGILAPGREKLIFPIYDIPTTEKNIYLYAKWQGNKYDVTLDVNGGNPIINMNISVTFGDYCRFGMATKLGYSFVGWCDNIKLGNLITDSAGETLYSWQYAESKTLYAKWQANTNEVTFDINGGVGEIAPVTATYDSIMPTLSSSVPTKTGYTFNGFYDKATGGAKYYNANLTSVKIFDKTVNTPLYAVWTAKKYEVTFDINGGVGEIAPVTATYDSIMPILSNNAPTKTGYTFNGFYDKATGGVKYYNANLTSVKIFDKTVNVILYAVWVGDITFDANGGTGEMAKQIIMAGETVSLSENTFTKAGFVFAGWSRTATGEVEFKNKVNYTIAGGSTTLYAVWLPSENVVIFDSNGGTNTMENQIIKTGEKMNLSANLFTRADYTFMGWATSPTGSVIYANKEPYTMGVKKSNNLYAVWSQTYYTEGLTFEPINDCYKVLKYTGQSSDVIIPYLFNNKKVISIGDSAFWNCSALKNITIPSSVQNIEVFAFIGCTSLTSITIPSSVQNIKSHAFADCTSLSSITLPSNLTSIGEYAFNRCTSLTSIKLPNSLIEIAGWTFEGCSALKNITIPNNLTCIQPRAFTYCISLTNITIPSSVSYIGFAAFCNCAANLTIHIKGRSAAPSGWNSDWDDSCSAKICWNCPH